MVLKSGDCNSLEGGAPPHDIIGAPLEESLPKEELLRDIVLTSRAILEKHEINMKRAARNERKANLVWLWSGGKKPAMPAFSELYGVSGSVVSGVYLIKGIGRCAGMAIIDVPGATGYFDTNYEGKVEYALRSLRAKDFVLIHVEAPDEAAHLGDLDMKVKAIEDFDALVVGNVLKGLADEFADVGYKVLAMPDHYTPVSVGTHTKEPVPFAIFSSLVESKMKKGGFDEPTAKHGVFGLLDARAQDLMRLFFRN